MKSIKIKVVKDKDYQMNLRIGNQIFRLGDMFGMELIDSEMESGDYELVFKKIGKEDGKKSESNSKTKE